MVNLITSPGDCRDRTKRRRSGDESKWRSKDSRELTLHLLHRTSCRLHQISSRFLSVDIIRKRGSEHCSQLCLAIPPFDLPGFYLVTGALTYRTRRNDAGAA